MIARRLLPGFCLVVSSICAAQSSDTAAERELRHQSSQWLSVAPHLPDTNSGSPEELLVAADVLRARRLPEDALDFYRAALARGGSVTVLMNRIGVTELELQRPNAALMAFKHAIAADKQSAEGWNNLGAAEYVLGDFQSAISHYRHAVKLDRKAPVYHSNLGTALFERKDFEGARAQFATAIALDPLIFQRSGWAGVQAHILSAQDRGRFCFEMARLSAAAHNDESVLLWLGRAAEAGFDVKGELGHTRELTAYQHDARVTMMLANSSILRTRQIAARDIPALPTGAPALD